MPLDLVPLVSHDLRERVIHAHVAEIAVEHTKAVVCVLEEGVELTPVGAGDGDEPVEPRAKDDHCGGAADEDAAEEDRSLKAAAGVYERKSAMTSISQAHVVWQMPAASNRRSRCRARRSMYSVAYEAPIGMATITTASSKLLTAANAWRTAIDVRS